MSVPESPEMRAMLNDFATRCFRDVADSDYILARMALRARLVPQFLWSSLQAVEKYLKAILLYNRTPSAQATHGVSGLLAKVENIAALRLQISASTREFVEYLDMYGKFRYLEVSYHGGGLKLVSLDRAVWDIRRYCTVLNYSLTKRDGTSIPMLERELRCIEESEKNLRFKWFEGEIERIAANRKHPA